MRAPMALLAAPLAFPALAQEPGLARPGLLLREAVSGMPRGERQDTWC